MLSDIDYVKVGRRIRAVREEHNLTQDALATQCGCARNHLSSVENGKSRPSLELLVKIASILDSSIDYFLIDTPGVNTKYIVDTHIAKQLYRCTGQELSMISLGIEELLKYRNSLLTAAQHQENTDLDIVEAI